MADQDKGAVDRPEKPVKRGGYSLKNPLALLLIMGAACAICAIPADRKTPKPVRTQRIKPEVSGQEPALTEEHLRRVTELFNTYVHKKPIAEAEEEPDSTTGMRPFNGCGPAFTWKDIPALLEIARSDRLIEGMPSLIISSYAGRHCREGMIALWFIEGLRREQISLQRERQLGGPLQMHIAYSRLPLNPICVRDGMNIRECEESLEIHRMVLQAYRKWWQAVGSLPARHAAAFYPLDLTELRWFGAPDRWPEEPLKVYEATSSEGTAAERTIRELRRIEGSYEHEPGRTLQTVHYALRKPDAKAPFTPNMLRIQKTVLYYYDTQGKITRTESFMPLSGQP